MKTASLITLFTFTYLFTIAQNTTYYDQYGNVLGTSTTTSNNIFGNTTVRSNSQPIPPIDYEALRAGLAAREADFQAKKESIQKYVNYVNQLISKLWGCNPDMARVIYANDFNAYLSTIRNNDVSNNYSSIVNKLEEYSNYIKTSIGTSCR